MSLILLDLCLRKHKKYALYFQWFKWLPEIAAPARRATIAGLGKAVEADASGGVGDRAPRTPED